MELTTFLEGLKGMTIKTLDQNKPFSILNVDNNVVVVLIGSTNKERKIGRKGIEGAYQALRRNHKITRSEIEAEFSVRNPAYVAAILSKYPGVRVTLKPITLLFD